MDALRADLHVHTFYSGDNNLKPEEIISAAKEQNIDVLGIVDHNNNRGAKEVKKIAGDILVLVGQEVKTRDGEIIVFGIDKSLESEKDLLETCKAAKSEGGFIVIPHPFDPYRSGVGSNLNKILEYVDAIEVFNSKCLFNKPNNTAAEFARAHGKPSVAGSDAHLKSEIGNGITLLESKKTEKDVFEAIKNKKTSIHAKKIPILRRMGSAIKNSMNL